MNKYDDIIDLPHYEPRHPRMPMENRAAQFAPFAALTGHSAAIAETGRYTDRMNDLSEEDQKELSRRLNYACERNGEVTVVYFKPDMLKEGGEYVEITDRIKKIDESERLLYFRNGIKIHLDMIIEIKGRIFSSFE